MIYAKIIAGLIIAAALAGTVAWAHTTIKKAGERDAAVAERDAERDKHAAEISKISRDIGESESDRVEYVRRFDAIEAAIAGIKIPEPGKLVTVKEVPGAPCPRVAAGPEFVSVFNQAADLNASH